MPLCVSNLLGYAKCEYKRINFTVVSILIYTSLLLFSGIYGESYKDKSLYVCLYQDQGSKMERQESKFE